MGPQEYDVHRDGAAADEGAPTACGIERTDTAGAHSDLPLIQPAAV